MSYIGNPIVSTDFPKDTFSGNGSTTAFTMQIAPASVNAVIVVVSGVLQDPSTYTISGTTLTFSAAPPTGTSNISVRHLGVAGIPNVPATGSAVTSLTAGTGISLSGSTGAITVTNSSPAVTAGEAKAWCNYNGSTSTNNGSYNISSVTRSSAGNYAFAFTTAMSSAGYAVTVGFANTTTNTSTASNVLSLTTTGFSIQHIENGATVDANPICIAVFR